MEQKDENRQQIQSLHYNRSIRKSSLARNLLVARKAAGLTQEQLSERSGYSRLTVVNLENGQGEPRLSTITDLATALGISPLLLLITREELLAIQSINSRLRRIQKDMPDEKAVFFQLLYFTTTKDMLKGVDTILKVVSPEKKQVAMGLAIGTACKPGNGSQIGMALGELWKAPQVNRL